MLVQRIYDLSFLMKTFASKWIELATDLIKTIIVIVIECEYNSTDIEKASFFKRIEIHLGD